MLFVSFILFGCTHMQATPDRDVLVGIWECPDVQGGVIKIRKAAENSYEMYQVSEANCKNGEVTQDEIENHKNRIS